jgi:hypothetical protein
VVVPTSERAMTDQPARPQPGDRVRVTYETVVNKEGWFFGQHLHGLGFEEVLDWSVEVVPAPVGFGQEVGVWS